MPRDRGQAARCRHPRDARRPRRLHAPAGSAPSGSCAACRSASRSGRATSSTTRCSHRRDMKAKAPMPIDGLPAAVRAMLDRSRPTSRRGAHVPRARASGDTYDNSAMDGRPGFVVVPWAHNAANEAQVKTDTRGDAAQRAVQRRHAGGQALHVQRRARRRLRVFRQGVLSRFGPTRLRSRRTLGASRRECGGRPVARARRRLLRPPSRDRRSSRLLRPA